MCLEITWSVLYSIDFDLVCLSQASGCAFYKITLEKCDSSCHLSTLSFVNLLVYFFLLKYSLCAINVVLVSSVQQSDSDICMYSCCSVAKSLSTLCDPTDCSIPGFPVPHQLPEFAQVHVHWTCDAIQHLSLLPSSPFASNLSSHQKLFQWVSSLHQVAKVLELQLQHQSFQWIFRIDSL